MILSDRFAVSSNAAVVDDHVVIRVRGEIDLTTAQELTGPIDEAISARRHVVVVDLSEVTFMDSSGLTALVRCSRHADARGSTLVVRDPQPAVRRVLEISGLAASLGLHAE
jgi:anti-sigma B factor antagonist